MEDRQRTAKVPPPRQEAQAVGPADFTGELVRGRPARRTEDLHICPACDSTLVLPTDWAPATGRRWVVDLRCPECEWTGGGTYGQGVVDRFDEVLDDGTEAILQDLSTLSRANMEASIDAFVSALWAEQILPEDF